MNADGSGTSVIARLLSLTRGVRSTSGSLAYKDFIPDEDDIVVERMRAAGAMMLGKTNAPEFGYSPTGHNPVGSLRYLFDRFSIGTKVCPDAPIGHLFSNLFCGKPFVVAVVPFQQFFVQFHHWTKPSELRRLQRAL